MSREKLMYAAIGLLSGLTALLPLWFRNSNELPLFYSGASSIVYSYPIIGLSACLTSVLVYYILAKLFRPIIAVFSVIFLSFSSTLISHLHAFDFALYIIPLFLLYVTLRLRNFRHVGFLGVCISILGFDIALLVALFEFFSRMHKNQNPKKQSIWIISVFIASFIGFLSNLWMWNSTYSLGIFEYGDIFGFNILLLGVGIVGFFQSWNKRHKLAQVVSMLLIFLSGFSAFLAIIATIILSTYAGLLAHKVLKKQWEEPMLKILSIVILFGLLLASYTFFIAEIVEAKPQQNHLNALDYAQEYYGQVTIATTSDNAAFITALSNNTAYVAQGDDYVNLYKERDLQQSLDILQQNNVTLLFVDSLMRQQVWENSREGLQFHLQNNAVFKAAYDTGEITIYWINYNARER